MKAFLLFRDHDFDFGQTPPSSKKTLIPDLALDTLFSAMASRDEFLLSVAESVVLGSLDNDLDTILYRQSILKDCLTNPEVARGLSDGTRTFKLVEAEPLETSYGKDLYNQIFGEPSGLEHSGSASEHRSQAIPN
jgi:hypothetical protein